MLVRDDKIGRGFVAMIGMLRGQFAGPFQFFEVTLEIDGISNTRSNRSIRMEKSEKSLNLNVLIQ